MLFRLDIPIDFTNLTLHLYVLGSRRRESGWSVLGASDLEIRDKYSQPQAGRVQEDKGPDVHQTRNRADRC